MFLRAVAIYEKDVAGEFKRIKSAVQKKENKSFLDAFDEATMPLIIDDLEEDKISRTRSDEYFHYAEYHPDTGHICVLVSDRRLGGEEYIHLLINVNHVDRRSETVKTSLDDIVNQTLNYTGRDIHITNLQDGLDKLQNILVNETKVKLLQRGDGINDLEENTVRLSESASMFNKSSTDLKNSYGCCGVSLPSLPSLPIGLSRPK